jgi:hypothetical protein
MRNQPPEDVTTITIDCSMNRIDLEQRPIRWDIADKSIPESKSFLVAQLAALEARDLAQKPIAELRAMLLAKRTGGPG